MRKENGVWRIYVVLFDHDSAMSEVRSANMRSEMGRGSYDDSETSDRDKARTISFIRSPTG